VRIQANFQERRASTAAFTLIEMVLVLAILALLIGAGAMGLKNVFRTGQETKAKLDIKALNAALRMYEIDAGFLPTTEQGLKALVEQPTTQPVPRRWKVQLSKPEQLIDPWGKPYEYRRPGVKNSDGFDVWSLGVDGIESADDIFE
jgi:general secretion pathway protein G